MQRQFFAYIASIGNSGLKATKAEAIEWAKKQLGDKPQASEVHILETIAVVHRETPPIKITELVAPCTAAALQTTAHELTKYSPQPHYSSGLANACDQSEGA